MARLVSRADIIAELDKLRSVILAAGSKSVATSEVVRVINNQIDYQRQEILSEGINSHRRPTPGDTYCNNCGLSDKYWDVIRRCPEEKVCAR